MTSQTSSPPGNTSCVGRSAPSVHRVGVLALSDVVTFDLSVPVTVFGEMTPSVPVTLTLPLPAPLYAVRVCAARLPGRASKSGRRSVVTAEGFNIDVPYGLEVLTWADTVVVPGRSSLDQGIPPEALEALRAAHTRGARVVSICTGAFVLAAAGLLNGRRATTHWAGAGLLASAYPEVTVNPAVLYVDEGSICTSAGLAAGIDLCLHLVRADFGSDAANTIARRMVVAPHRSGGQAQFADSPVSATVDGGLESTRRWMLERLEQPLTIDSLARHASMSPRTFARRFAAEAGTTPLQWLLAQRVLLARRLLETSEEPIKRIAARAGFSDTLSLRQHFGRATGTTPLAYRRMFRGTP